MLYRPCKRNRCGLKSTRKTAHQKNSIWCWLRCNLEQFEAKKFRIKSFLQPFRRRESSSFANILFPQSLVWTTGVLQHQGLMEMADGAIRSRWTLISVNVQKLANNYPPLRSTGSNHKSNLKQREKKIFVICKHQLLFPKILFKNIFVEQLLEKHEVHLLWLGTSSQ